jgi:hypothetical protein
VPQLTQLDNLKTRSLDPIFVNQTADSATGENAFGEAHQPFHIFSYLIKIVLNICQEGFCWIFDVLSIDLTCQWILKWILNGF